ncbi:hypothetical protein HOR19_gp09 [Phage MedPE-SWcel-C56]|uniref:Uncharacterized protein n=1 Tax=Phage MedPE-SWcel-C56 TaxID=1871314 RepID=A0A1B1IXZ9_9CAUD|nr:hypothetical protein HOR19_gp09 [Phage MedPE-SWcel-C56]ANS06202.1 hypothetical protein [Phage MedPE-SWcel-C56]
MFDPDQYAVAARSARERGCKEDAFLMAVCSIKARAEWVQVNGRWVRREGVMK